MGKLPYYEKFERRLSTYPDEEGGHDNPLGAQHPMILNKHLEYLEEVAQEAGLTSSWWDLLDPTLSYQENKQLLMEKTGMDDRESPFKSDRKSGYKEGEERAEDYNKRLVEKKEKATSGRWMKFQNVWDIIDLPPEPESSVVNTKTINEDGVFDIRPAHEIKFGDVSDRIDPEEFQTITEKKDRKDGDSQASEPSNLNDDGNQEDEGEESNALGDEYGYASVRSPKELVGLLDRAKDEYDFGSRRAVIEAIAATVANCSDNFKTDDGKYWDELEIALEASLEVDESVLESADEQEEFDPEPLTADPSQVRDGDAMAW